MCMAPTIIFATCTAIEITNDAVIPPIIKKKCSGVREYYSQNILKEKSQCKYFTYMRITRNKLL